MCFSFPHSLSWLRWASTDVPWGDLDGDGIEVPSDYGEWVSLHSSLVVGVPANATLRDMKADDEEEDSESEEEKDRLEAPLSSPCQAPGAWA
jgi:hypothetical protein